MRIEHPSAKRPKVTNREMDVLLATVWGQGWWCVRGGNNHVKCYPPDGTRIVTIPCTPSNRGRTAMNKKKALQRKGARF